MCSSPTNKILRLRNPDVIFLLLIIAWFLYNKTINCAWFQVFYVEVCFMDQSNVYPDVCSKGTWKRKVFFLLLLGGMFYKCSLDSWYVHLWYCSLFYIFTAFLSGYSIKMVESEVLKFPTKIMDLSNAPFDSVSFCFM